MYSLGFLGIFVNIIFQRMIVLQLENYSKCCYAVMVFRFRGLLDVSWEVKGLDNNAIELFIELITAYRDFKIVLPP